MLTPGGYLTGRCTQAEAARELGISVRQLQRIEEIALARWALGVCREIRRQIGDLDSVSYLANPDGES